MDNQLMEVPNTDGHFFDFWGKATNDNWIEVEQSKIAHFVTQCR